MGSSSKLFLEMQAEDIQTLEVEIMPVILIPQINIIQLVSDNLEEMYHNTFNKKDAEDTGIKLATDIFENGVISTVKAFSNIVKLKASIDAAVQVFRERIVIGNSITYNGVSFTNKSGAERLKYSDDWKVAELEDALKQRKELVKVATKSKDAIYDSEGIEVCKVSREFTKDSIVITFNPINHT